MRDGILFRQILPGDEAKKQANIAKQKQKDAERNLATADSLQKVAKVNAALAKAQASRANKNAEQAKAALQLQLEAERATKRQQLQTFLAQASDFRSKKQYEAALDAYRNALPLAEDAKTKGKLQS